MSSQQVLDNERRHLACLLVALQRCAWFLHQSEGKIDWPLHGPFLEKQRKDVDLFETLAAINERFAKLQDTLAATMRHAVLLMSEPADSFLKVLVFYEKLGVLDSSELWQQSRMARNMAAHDYETDYAIIAEHFNTLHQLSPMLYSTAQRLIVEVQTRLAISPENSDFQQEFDTLFPISL